MLRSLSASGRVIAQSGAGAFAGHVDGHLRLAPGVLKETNGIALLAARSFDATISANANRVHVWLSDYMAHPAECETLLE